MINANLKRDSRGELRLVISRDSSAVTDEMMSKGGDGRELQTLAFLAVAGAVLTWSISSIVIKTVSTTGLVASFYRLWFAVPLLWLVAAFAPSIRQRMNRTWLTSCLLGGGLFGIHQIFFFNSIKLTSVANVTIIGALQPALVILVAGRMFGETVTARALIWSLVAVGGTVLVVLGSAGTPSWSPSGDALAFANLFAFTAYFLASKRIRSRVGASEYVIGMTSVAAIVMLAACLLTGQSLASPQGWDWLLLVFIAVFPGTLGHFLTNWAHRHTSAFVMSIMLLAVPVLASAGAMIFLHEEIHRGQILGGAVVLIAISVIVYSAQADAAEELAESVAETDAP